MTSHPTEVVDGKRRIKVLPPLVYHIPRQNKRERKQYTTIGQWPCKRPTYGAQVRSTR